MKWGSLSNFGCFLVLFDFVLVLYGLGFVKLLNICPQPLINCSHQESREKGTMMSVIEVKAAQVTHPSGSWYPMVIQWYPLHPIAPWSWQMSSSIDAVRTGDPKFAVMQPFPAAISEKEADPFLMCHLAPFFGMPTVLLLRFPFHLWSR